MRDLHKCLTSMFRSAVKYDAYEIRTQQLKVWWSCLILFTPHV